MRVYEDALSDDAVACQACGQVCNPHLTVYGEDAPPPSNEAPMCFAKGRDYQYNKARNIPNMGRRVRSDAAQHALYQDRIESAARRARAARRDRGRKSDIQWEHVGRVPLEVYESVVENERDKLAWSKDPVGLMKRTGTWFGD